MIIPGRPAGSQISDDSFSHSYVRISVMNKREIAASTDLL